jgi:hypothetical protein
MRLPSAYGKLVTTWSATAIISSNARPPQSPLISSMNFWPYPVDPRGFGITTTYPAAANTCAFQR